MEVSEKFFGYNSLISAQDRVVGTTLPKIANIVGQIRAESSKSEQWRIVADHLQEFARKLSSPQSSINSYKLEVVTEVVVPYLSKLNGRYHVDQTRTRQLVEILGTLLHDDIQHPAIALNIIERVREEVRVSSSNYIFQSELLTLLNNTLAKQWRPILLDLRGFLQNIGGKLITVAVVTIVGWPIVLIAPLLMNTNKLLQIIQELEKHHQLSPTSTFHLIKIVAVMIVSAKLMAILQMYQSVGFMCGFISAICFIISSSDSLLKTTAPMLAPNAKGIDEVLGKLMNLDIQSVMKMVPGSTERTDHRVEDLNSTDRSSSTANSDGNEDYSTQPFSTLDPTGIRRRSFMHSHSE